MPLEYKVLNVSILEGNHVDIENHLNYYGAMDWEVSAIHEEFGIVIFKRAVEINQKLRERQTKEESKNGSSDTT